MKAAIYARKTSVLFLAVLLTYGCSKPFTPLITAVDDCLISAGDSNSDAFHRCMHDKGWIWKGPGVWEQT